jgi:hypothetical protein
MIRIREIPSENLEDVWFDWCVKSKSGCNVVVGDKYYNIYVNNIGEYVTTEFEIDYELTEEEFNKFKK